MLLVLCSVSVFVPVSGAVPSGCGHGCGPRVAAGQRAVSTDRGPACAGRFLLTGSGLRAGLVAAGREYGDLRFPGRGFLGSGGALSGTGFPPSWTTWSAIFRLTAKSTLPWPCRCSPTCAVTTPGNGVSARSPSTPRSQRGAGSGTGSSPRYRQAAPNVLVAADGRRRPRARTGAARHPV
jgi:hypothetical protein